MRLQALRAFGNDLQAARHFYESIPGLQTKREREGTAIRPSPPPLIGCRLAS